LRIGVLALQGAFIEHIKIFDELGVSSFEIRQLKDIDKDFDALILPGGESTVQTKLLKKLGLFEPLKEKIQKGLPVMATCAGLILLAKDIKNQKNSGFNTLPVTVVRNGYGRQIGSFKVYEKIDEIGKFEMIFIRAPYIESVEKEVKILAKVDGNIVCVRYKNQLALSFHPELTKDNNIHKYFLSMISQFKKTRTLI
jgi:5'-phosphate synthase pdxT subunit